MQQISKRARSLKKICIYKLQNILTPYKHVRQEITLKDST